MQTTIILFSVCSAILMTVPLSKRIYLEFICGLLLMVLNTISLIWIDESERLDVLLLSVLAFLIMIFVVVIIKGIIAFAHD